MNPNLKWKVVFILLVVVGCIYGLIGLPTFPTSLVGIDQPVVFTMLSEGGD